MQRTALTLFVLVATAGLAHAGPVSYTDLWDYSQGASVTASSVMEPGSTASNMFGTVIGSTSDLSHNAIFDDYGRAGTVHWVEWMTPSAITLASFQMLAYHDLPPRDINERGFKTFRLYTGDGLGTWTLLYTLPNTDPDGDLLYGGGGYYTAPYYLEVEANVTPTVSKFFRAEFVQYGDRNGSARGPRIAELDGFATQFNVVPVPTAALAGIGVLAVLGTIRRLRRRR